MTVRLLLGVFEAAVSPAFGMIVGAYYRREEHGLRQCLWFLGNGVSGLFGSMVAYGIAHIEASIAQWKVGNGLQFPTSPRICSADACSRFSFSSSVA